MELRGGGGSGFGVLGFTFNLALAFVGVAAYRFDCVYVEASGFYFTFIPLVKVACSSLLETFLLSFWRQFQRQFSLAEGVSVEAVVFTFISLLFRCLDVAFADVDKKHLSFLAVGLAFIPLWLLSDSLSESIEIALVN